MNTELDHDDAIGQRLHALRSWHPVAPGAGAWRGVERRRRRTRTRRVACGVLAVVVALGTVGVILSRSSTTGKRVSVVEPTNPSESAPLARPLPTAPVAALDISPAGPYRSGQSVRISFKPSQAPSFATGALNPGISVCYPWSGGETCDPTIQSKLVGTDPAGVSTYRLTVPGWVYTPTGLRSCETLHCRFEIENADGTRGGTAPVEIAPGAEPHVPARLVSIHRDEALVEISLDGIDPDPLWTQWRATVDPATAARFPSGGIRICAFAARLLCDGLVQPDPPPFDGRSHSLTVATNRLLLTPGSWIDCVKVVCALAITRTIGPGNTPRLTQADPPTIALLPYQLPPTTPEMRRPTLTFDPAGPFRIGDTVTATLHDPPPNVEADSRLLLWRCSGVDLETAADCTGDDTNTWSKLADGSLQQRVVLREADATNGIYLSVALPTPDNRGYPWVARTHPFTVTLTQAPRQHASTARKTSAAP